MRELEIKYWCDPCAAQDIRTEGEELPAVAVGSAKPKIIAMCKQHRTDIYDPFVELVLEFGATPEQLGSGRRVARKPAGLGAGEAPPSQATDSSTGKPVQCPLCSESRKNPAGVAKHLRREHDKSLFEAIGAGGTLYDVDGEAVDTPKARPRRNGG